VTLAGDGDGGVAIDLQSLDREFALVERRCEYVCASGDRFSGRWRGVRVVDLVEDALEPDATHLLVEAGGGFRVCVSIAAALDGILATERLDGADEGLPRLIAPSIDGTRTVKRIVRIEGRRLRPGEDPEDLERIEPTPAEEATDHD
jgi:DMSO/TMAO reductase YedYZ molybdopterin-dependent catalytic subunit